MNNHELQAIDKEKKHRKYITNITASALALPVWNFDEKTIKEQLLSLRRDGEFCGARVLDVKNNILVDNNFPSTLGFNQWIEKQDIIFSNPTKSSSEIETLGQLEICFDKTSLLKELRSDTIKYLFFIILVMGVVLIACYLSLLIIVRPLLSIHRAMSQVSTNMTPITIPSLLKNNEIGSLTHSFNSMVRDLEKSYIELKSAKEEAESANAAKTNFLANMTHELRTPLNSIIGITNLLLERKHTPEDNEMLSVVQESSKILLEVVSDVLDISKIEAGEIHLEKTSFDFEKVIEKCLLIIRPLATKKNLIIANRHELELPYLIGDPLRLAQVINNFLSNAVKYTSNGGITINVSSTPISDNQLEIYCRVTDSGIGIPNEKIGMMFNKFMQVDASTTRRYGGTGLGLSISKQLVELMGGAIGVESEENIGSTFWFKIPFEISSISEIQEKSVANTFENAIYCGIVPPSRAEILVAEDHPLNQFFITLLLKKYGFVNFDIVENGNAVLAAISKKDYDLVLMDCFMPEINGLDTTIEIRNQEKDSGKHLPIIAMTANAMLDYEQKCFAAGMDAFMLKPIIENDFISTLSKWIKFDLSKGSTLDTTANEPVEDFINMNIIKSFSGGDHSLENKLINMFVIQSDINIATLKTSRRANEEHKWINAAHMLKGGASSIGAERLRKLCAEAQLMENATHLERTTILKQIETAYTNVKNQLNALGYQA